MQEFTFAYGNKKIKISLEEKNILGILDARQLKKIEKPEQEIKKSLYNPIDSPPLNKLVKRGDKIAILVSDHTRTTRSEIFIPVLLNELNLNGIADKDISIFFANGTHKLNTEEEQENILGKEVIRRVKVFEHNCFGKFKYFGKTSFGTPVYLNSNVTNHNKIILTGNIIYHYFAGFGGGRKTILPGIASNETIFANHSLLLHNKIGCGMNPNCTTGILKNNPIHLDMIEAAKLANPAFMLNVVLNDYKEIAGIFAGDFIKAHLKGCKFVEKYYGVKINKLADLVIASCGGYPKDINFYQSHKAMDNAVRALKLGGVLILLAECKRGLGGEDFSKYFSYGNLFDMEMALRKKYSIVGHIAYSTLEKAKKAKIILISSLPDKTVKKMNIIPAHSINEALNIAKKMLCKNPKIYLIPQAYITVPIYKK